MQNLIALSVSRLHLLTEIMPIINSFKKFVALISEPKVAFSYEYHADLRCIVSVALFISNGKYLDIIIIYFFE